jgi:hypothetical protein
MNGIFNVAVADFGEVKDSTGVAHASKDGQWLADFVFDKLQTRLDEVPELAGDVDLQHEHIDFIPGGSPEARQQAAAELASQIKADVVIYGYLDIDDRRLSCAEFYISPRLTVQRRVLV